MRFISLLSAIILLPNSIFAEELQPAPEPIALEKVIQDSIADLSKPSFAARNAATQQLRDAGPAAFPALVDAAKHGSSETLSRALAILKGSLKSDDAERKARARESLDKLAQTANSSAARSAQQILREQDKPNQVAASAPQFQNPRVQVGFAMPIPNGPPQFNGQVVNRAMTMRIAIGEQKVEIQTDATGKIKMGITKKDLQGLDVTQQFEAANATELRAKHPEAHQLFQKYANRNIGPGMAMEQFPARPNFNAPRVPAEIRQRILQSLQSFDAQIELIKQRVAQAPTPAEAEALNRTLQRLIESRDRMGLEANR
jgi:hypothetical protein